MRRVVVAPDENGKSYVVEDADVGPGLLWNLNPADTAAWIAELSQGDTFTSYEPSPGGAMWAFAELPPGAGAAAGAGNDSLNGMDADGFHATRTVDFIVTVDAGIVLSLDHGDVDLEAGDCVVLQAARHAWRNTTDKPVRFIDVLVAQVKDV